MIGASDTEGETDKEQMMKPAATPSLTPISNRKIHPPIIKKSSTATNLVKQLGMDHDIVKEMIADGGVEIVLFLIF